MAELIVEPIQTAELESSGYAGQPEGNIDLTENNVQVNVAPYKYATPKIPEPSGTKEITENGLYDVFDYAEADVQIPPPKLEEKQATPSTTSFDVEPSQGYDGLSKVTVNATPLESKTVTPSTEQQTIIPEAPAIGFSQFTVEPMPAPPVLIEKTITENGTYNAADDNADGYREVEVGVPDNFTKYLDKTIEEVNSDVSGSLSLSFRNCNLLKTVYLPNVTSMSVDYSSLYLFQGCNNLERINMSSYINIPSFWLQNNSSVKEVIITGAQTIGQDAFYSCINLVLRELPSQVSSIGDSAFKGCIKIPYLDMRNLQQIPTLGSGVFSDTTFPFYFRDQQQLEEFAAATNWSVYADRFQIKEATS